ncbi:MAG TPA: hypothetical protein VI731_09810, partial [Bacteroidia bacterium]|nr:hypothetical protein [Bacteroidia bacterium]
GNSPATHQLIPANETVSSALFSGFNGHPAGIAGLMFFALMPFFLVWESFGIRRPFSYPANAFLKLQALFLFLGAPYCYYIATYQHGIFYDREHTTELAWGGWILFVQNIFFGALIFTIIAAPNGKLAALFEQKQN